MTESGETEYEFDIAVSFAGEDRDYVEEVIQGVKDAGHTAFYDDDHIADMWGEDGVEYLSNVYMNRRATPSCSCRGTTRRRCGQGSSGARRCLGR